MECQLYVGSRTSSVASMVCRLWPNHLIIRRYGPHRLSSYPTTYEPHMRVGQLFILHNTLTPCITFSVTQLWVYSSGFYLHVTCSFANTGHTVNQIILGFNIVVPLFGENWISNLRKRGSLLDWFVKYHVKYSLEFLQDSFSPCCKAVRLWLGVPFRINKLLGSIYSSVQGFNVISKA